MQGKLMSIARRIQELQNLAKAAAAKASSGEKQHLT